MLGMMIYPKVQFNCQNKSNAPKITGMLIDFNVFDITDILEFMENEEELKQKVTEAEKLLN